MNSVNEFIIGEIEHAVNSDRTPTRHRQPLVGFAPADHPLFGDLKNSVNNEHFLPADLLSAARTVVTFFVPFAEEIVCGNQKDSVPTREWAYAKNDTQNLINQIIDDLKERLFAKGIECSANPGAAPYDRAKFVHRWSLKHVAYICGLGNFGLNQMLITDSGCAGRYGGFVISAAADYTPVVTEEYCLYKLNKSCGLCVKNCPAGALTYTGLDKARCSNQINNVTDKYFGGDRIYRVCGKCAALPCATKNPAANRK